MRLFEMSGKLQPNMYFRFYEEVPVWVSKGFKPSNHYYGSSRLYQPIYEEIRSHVADQDYYSDQLHWLHGGLFFVRHGSEGVRARLAAPGEFAPFEKSYGGDSTIGALRQYLDADYIDVINFSSEIFKANYKS